MRVNRALGLIVALSACSLSGYAAAPQEIAGTWKITRVIPTSNVQTEPDRSFIGKTFTYQDGRASLSGAVVKQPSYAVKRVGADVFFKDNQIKPSELGIASDPVATVEVSSSSGETVTQPGAQLYIKNPKTMITIWDGIYYELTRVRK